MPELPQLLDAIREQPDDGPRWLALAGWLGDEGRDDEAAAVRVFWPTLRDDVLKSRVSLDRTLANLKESAAILGSAARKIEERRHEPPE
jgi:uncharacterized protein (TIGR02996 family)